MSYQSQVQFEAQDVSNAAVLARKLNIFQQNTSTALAKQASSSATVAWSNITGIPSEFPPIPQSFDWLIGNIAPGQVPAAAVTQFQNQLLIKWSQLQGVPSLVTAAEAVEAMQAAMEATATITPSVDPITGDSEWNINPGSLAITDFAQANSGVLWGTDIDGYPVEVTVGTGLTLTLGVGTSVLGLGDGTGITASQVSFNDSGTLYSYDDVQDAMTFMDAGWQDQYSTAGFEQRAAIAAWGLVADSDTVRWQVDTGSGQVIAVASAQLTESLPASAITFDDYGTLYASVNVQAALDFLDYGQGDQYSTAGFEQRAAIAAWGLVVDSETIQWRVDTGSGLVTAVAVDDGAVTSLEDLTDVDVSPVIGDILYYNGTYWVALTAGADGYVLTMGESEPMWAVGAQLSLEDLTDVDVSPATGDILYYNGTHWVALPAGTDGYVLAMGASEPMWTAVTGTGTVTSVTVESANGFSGTVADDTTTPEITISTTVTGILYGDGTSVAEAVVGNFPTLNQSTTGTAAGLSVTLAIASGGTGETTAATAFDALSPLTTEGDMLYENSSPAGARLAIGVSGYLLMSSGSVPEWAPQTDITSLGTIGAGVWEGTAVGIGYGGTGETSAVAAFDALSPLTTAGDMLYENASTEGARLAIGVSGYLMMSSGSAPEWAPQTDITSLGTIVTGAWEGTAVAIAYGGTGKTTAAAAFDALMPLTTTGDILYASGTDTASRLAIGTTGEVLTVSGGVPVWAAAASGGVTSIAGTTNEITASASTGAVTLSLPTSVTISGTMTAGTFSGAGTSLTGTASSLTAGSVTTTSSSTNTNYGVALAAGTSIVYSSSIQANPDTGTLTVDTLTFGSGTDASIGSSPTTYGSITVSGSTTSYTGIQFTAASNRTFMVYTAGQESGVYDVTSSSWDWLFASGELYYVTSCSGNWTVNGTLNATSDIRLKDNIRTINDSGAIVDGIRGVRFDWHKDGNASAGVIAQEVEVVMPELIDINKHDMKSVNYNGLVAVLIEQVKELRARVAQLENK